MLKGSFLDQNLNIQKYQQNTISMLWQRSHWLCILQPVLHMSLEQNLCPCFTKSQRTMLKEYKHLHVHHWYCVGHDTSFAQAWYNNRYNVEKESTKHNGRTFPYTSAQSLAKASSSETQLGWLVQICPWMHIFKDYYKYRSFHIQTLYPKFQLSKGSWLCLAMPNVSPQLRCFLEVLLPLKTTQKPQRFYLLH